jgi:hypothetical protein
MIIRVPLWGITKWYRKYLSRRGAVLGFGERGNYKLGRELVNMMATVRGGVAV